MRDYVPGADGGGLRHSGRNPHQVILDGLDISKFTSRRPHHVYSNTFIHFSTAESQESNRIDRIDRIRIRKFGL